MRLRAAPGLRAAHVELFDGDIPLGEFRGTPPEYRIERPAAGIHALIAVATADDGTRFLSHPNTIVVK